MYVFLKKRCFIDIWFTHFFQTHTNHLPQQAQIHVERRYYEKHSILVMKLNSEDYLYKSIMSKSARNSLKSTLIFFQPCVMKQMVKNIPYTMVHQFYIIIISLLS